MDDRMQKQYCGLVSAINSFQQDKFLFTLIYFQVSSLLHGLEILTIAENRKDSFQGLNSGLMSDSVKKLRF